MSNVFIKIKNSGGRSPDQTSDELKIDLRENLSTNKKGPLKKWLFLFIFLFLAASIFTISQNIFFSNKTAFSHLIPEEAVVFSLINQESLYNQTASLYGFLQESNFYGYNAISKINGYLNQAGLSFNDFYPLFKKQSAFILMASNSETPLPFVVIFEKNQSSSKIEQFLSQIEPSLKEDFNFSIENYRQIKITRLKPISFASEVSPDLYTYAQIGDYFIVCNSLQKMKIFIDSIID